MDRLLQDLKFAARVLIRDRGFTATVILTLAICSGAHAGIFAIVNSVLLQPLPVSHAEQLVPMYNAYPGAGVDAGAGTSNARGIGLKRLAERRSNQLVRCAFHPGLSNDSSWELEVGSWELSSLIPPA
jgi:hypothetical protein